MLEELKTQKRWICYNAQKSPINPNGGGYAASDNPDTWADYATASAFFRKNVKVLSGVGLVLRDGDGLAFIDCDTVIDPATNECLDDLCSRLLSNTETYAEYSQSGYGFHIIGKAESLPFTWHQKKLPPNGIQRPDIDYKTGKRRTDKDGKPKDKIPEIEVYTGGRFCFLTGKTINGMEQLDDVSDLLDIIKEHFEAPAAAEQLKVGYGFNDNFTVNRPIDFTLDDDTDIGDALRALDAIDPDKLDGGSYDTWLRVITAAKAAGLTMAEVDAWSQRGSKYSPGEISRRWDGLDGSNPETLFYFAYQQGYVRYAHNAQSGEIGWNDEISYSHTEPKAEPAASPTQKAEAPAASEPTAKRFIDCFEELPKALRERALEARKELLSNAAYVEDHKTDRTPKDIIATICEHEPTGDPDLIKALFLLEVRNHTLDEDENGLMERPKQNKTAAKYRKKTNLEIAILEALELAPEKAAPLQIITAAELQNKDIPPVKFVVDGLIPEGLSLIAAPPKYGKSWLCLDICEAVATGGVVLGHKATQGAVLYLALEDSEGRIKRRLESMAAAYPNNLYFAFSAATLDSGLCSQLEQAVKQHNNISCVIIDTLARVRGEMKARESVYQYDAREGGALQKFAMKHHIAVVIIHHTRKGGDDNDIMNTISGSTGLTGIMDCMAVLSRSNRTDNTTLLSITGRDIEASETVLQFDKTAKRWQCCGTEEEYNAKYRRFAYDRNALIKTIKRRIEDGGGVYDATPQEIRNDGVFITGGIVATSTQSLHSIISNFAELLAADGITYELTAQKKRYKFYTADYLKRQAGADDWTADAEAAEEVGTLEP